MVSGSNDSDARWIKASGISLRAGAAQRDPAAAPHTHRVQQGPSQPVGKAEELGSVCLYFSSPHLPDAPSPYAITLRIRTRSNRPQR